MEKNVTVTGSVNRAVNFAMQQNYVPVIRNLVVNNESEEKLQNLTVKITFEPEFAHEYSYAIAEVHLPAIFLLDEMAKIVAYVCDFVTKSGNTTHEVIEYE